MTGSNFQRDLMKNINTTVAYAALAFAASCYGGWHVLCNVAMTRGTPPIIFSLYRCAGGMICCVLAMKICPELGTKTRKERGQTIFGHALQEYNGYSRKDELMFTGLGLCMAGNIVGFIIANTELPALTCSIFAPLVPVCTALISIMSGLEESHQTKLMGLCVAVFGAMVVVFFEEDHHAATTVTPMPTIMPAVGNATMLMNATKNATGVAVANATKAVVRTAAPVVASAAVGTAGKMCGYFFLFLSTFSAATYFVLLKTALKTYTPVRATAMAYSHAFGFIFLAALMKHGLEPTAWFLYGDGVSWLCLIYAAVITTGLTYSIQAWAVGQTSPSTVTAFSTLSPVAAAMISVAFLDVHLKSYQLVGGALIIGGLWVNITVQAQEAALAEKVPLLKPTEYGALSN